MKKVVLKWGAFSVLKKVEKVRFVVQKMTENAAVFPTPNPTMTELTNQANALEQAETAASEGGKDRTQVRDEHLVKMMTLMDQEVYYVQGVTKGDPNTTALAGMDTQEVGSSWPLPEKPQGFVAKPGKFNGSVYMRCKGTKYKKQYVFQMLVETDTGTDWKTIASQGRNTYLHEGLERGRIYRFRVYATNSLGAGPVSLEAESAAT